MTNVPTWEVDLLIDAPVTIRRPFRTREPKGFRPNDPFYSDIEISRAPSGLRTTITARALNERLAREAAVFFFGRVLDILAFRINMPLFLSLTESETPRNSRVRQPVRRNIEDHEIKDSFQEADHLAIAEPPFLKSLSWYRKGLYTEDPFDKFLALWISIEIVAAQYYGSVTSIDQERAKNGSKSQIWECFKALWGECDQWPIIPGNDRWIDENYELRKDIAHGISSVDIEKVALVLDKLTVIPQVAHRFLQDWRDNILYRDLQPASQRLLHPDEAFPSQRD